MARSTEDDFDPTAGEFDDEFDGIEPGSEGAYGTGVEGADQIMTDERVRTAGNQIDEWADFGDEFGEDDSAAAEQGNRDQDQMISSGDSLREVEQLAGDDWNVDAVGDSEVPLDERRLAEGVDHYGDAAGLDGSVGGEDPLAGGPR